MFISTQQFHDFYQMVEAKIISWKISNEKATEQSEGVITWLIMYFANVWGEIMHEYQISMIGRWTACLTTADSKLEITSLWTGIQYYIPIEKGMLCECAWQKR